MKEARIVRVGDRIEEGRVVEIVNFIAYAEDASGSIQEVNLR